MVQYLHVWIPKISHWPDVLPWRCLLRRKQRTTVRRRRWKLAPKLARPSKYPFRDEDFTHKSIEIWISIWQCAWLLLECLGISETNFYDFMMFSIDHLDFCSLSMALLHGQCVLMRPRRPHWFLPDVSIWIDVNRQTCCHHVSSLIDVSFTHMGVSWNT